MDNRTFKQICLIAGITLVGSMLVVLLCMVAFMAGSMNNRLVVQQPIYGYAPPPSISESEESLAQLENDAINATALLYFENKSGGMDFYCTATAFERVGHYYKFLTAAHCVSSDDTVNKMVRIKPGKWYINFDMPNNNEFHRANVLAAGYMSDGDDVAVLGAYLDDFNPIINLSQEDAVIGERIINIAGPRDLGKQLIRGNISQVTPGRGSFLSDRIMIQIHSGGGSSGSAIISQNKKAIVGVLVAGFGGFFQMEPFYDVTVAVPIGKFHRFWAAIKANNYEHFNFESYEPTNQLSKDMDTPVDSDTGTDAGVDCSNSDK
ncbi:MAG: hypothetical protein COU29_03645 [Candidatus Magasanikbacteria bacterium CG10_big_fil_rev_8_21_14_0_10_36_32]|uniref:Peptidase S1 domain-containing protein n=1 Tax=Candidatus Magasanikbacteria bacterium CG10_big_fil_rev_8_21_14_0_10_36_32 TaxID=1974646 RepID=A0A2M6W5M0_9BACT|nr:MAG: hypothetical protein COU29_03645 [Candidatus Magasanikbacteria bacterium CG10_big_fil_rev_8_21_14_0_10_36_32]